MNKLVRSVLITALLSCFLRAEETPAPHPSSAAYAAYPLPSGLLPGFQPMNLDGRAVRFHNCNVDIETNGLIRSIEHDGVQLLAESMKISGKINGKTIVLNPDMAEIVENTPANIAFRATGTHAGAAYTVDTMAEQDGLIRFVLNFSSSSPATYEDIFIHLSLASAQVDYLYDWKSYPVPKGSGIIWDSGKTRAAGGGLGLFKNQFVPYLWMGNSHRGLSWFTESDEGWQDGGRPVWILTRNANVLELTVRVISGRAEKQNFNLDFGIMINPVKQIDRVKSRNWQYCGMARDVWEKGADADTIYKGQLPDYVNRSDVLMFSSDFNNVYEERHAQFVLHPAELSANVAAHHKAGFSNVVYYTCMDNLISLHPDYERIKSNAMKIPAHIRQWPGPSCPKAEQHERLIICENSQDTLAVILNLAETLVKKHGVDGIYLDNFMYGYGCERCGFAKPDGRIQPVFRIYQYREFMKKLNAVFIRNGKEPLIWIHHTGPMQFPVMSFATMGLAGEILTQANKKDQFDHVELFDEARCIVELNSEKWGLPIIWYPDLKYTIFKQHHPETSLTQPEYCEKYGTTYLGMCLLYGAYPSRMGFRAGTQVIEQVLAARNNFGMSLSDVRFLPWWEPEGNLSVKSKSRGFASGDLKASVYVRGNKVMIAIVNFNDSALDAEVVLKNGLLSKTCPGSVLKDCLTRQNIQLDAAGKCTVSIQPHGFALLLGEADQVERN